MAMQIVQIYNLNTTNTIFFTAVSRQIDQAAQQVYEDLRLCLWRSPEHFSRLSLLCSQPANCGPTASASILMHSSTAFEQMIALEDWMRCYTSQIGRLKNRYTFCFSNPTPRLQGRAVPLSIQKNANDLWRVELGNQGRYAPAPRYVNGWEIVDPWQDEKFENFIYPLESLEMVRQPEFLGATLIKGNAFESEYIDQDWRYGVTDLWGRDKLEACVEFPKQNSLSASRAAIKLNSAAFNLFQLIRQGLGDIDLCKHAQSKVLKYFDSPEQMPRYFSLSVTPLEILRAINQVQTTPSGKSGLYYKMFKLMLSKIGPQSTPSLRRFVIESFRQAPITLKLSRQQR